MKNSELPAFPVPTDRSLEDKNKNGLTKGELYRLLIFCIYKEKNTSDFSIEKAIEITNKLLDNLE